MTEPSSLPWFVGNEGIEAYYKDNPHAVILDWETTNLQYGDPTNPDNDIVLGCWYVVRDGSITKKHGFGDEYSYQELLDDIGEADFLVAHNAQFELGWLARCGLDLHDVLVWDTMVGEWVIHGNITVPYNLEATATRYGLGHKGSIVSKMINLGTCPSTIPRSWLLSYCYTDIELTYQVFLKQRDKIAQLNLEHIMLSRCLTIPVLTDMTAQGLELDKEAVLAEHDKQTQIVEEYGEKLDKVTGGINLNSPKQLTNLLYNELKFERLLDRQRKPINSAAQGVIAQLKAETPDQIAFKEAYFDYNKANTLLTKTLNYFKKVCEFMDGKFYGRILQCRTKTHRLAGAGVPVLFPGDKTPTAIQLQNIPRQYKRLFIAHDPEYVVLESDGAGMEARVAAILAHDEVMRDDILDGADIHAVTRDTMNAAYKKLGIDVVLDRQDAKSSTFSPLYGGNGKDEAEKEYVQFFRKKYHAIATMQRNWTLKVADTKKLTTPYGFHFYWPTAEMQRSGYVTYTTEIYNFAVQGAATAEMIPVALVAFWHRTRGMKVELFNTVHDSIVTRVHKDELTKTKELSKIAMTTDVYNFFREVYGYTLWEDLPLGAGMKHGAKWGESETEEVYEVWADGNERMTLEAKNPETGKKEKSVVLDTRSM